MQAQMLDLSDMLDGVAEGSVAVPDFQREFVWSDVQVRSLLGTALNGWPAGSLLLMRSDQQLFQLRPLEAAPPIGDVHYIVLDGQQRLTALYHALRNAGPSVYAIDLSDLELATFDPTSLEERLISIKRDEWNRNYRSVTRQRARWLLPIHSLQSAASFFEWRDAVTESLGNMDFEYRDLLTTLYRDYFSVIHRYNLPAVVLESQLEVTAVARIFEKVNRTGTLLNAFDLMVARVYEPGWNLREQWETARLTDPYLDYFLNSDGMPVLQSIALRSRHDVGQRAVLELPSSLVHREWDSAVKGTSEAIRVLFEACGLRSGDWMPYGVMLVALAALGQEENLLTQHLKLIESWFWSRGFGQAFDAAANTRIVADYDRLVEATRQGWTEISSVSPVGEASLLEATRRGQRAIWAMFMCALARNGSLDPVTMRSPYETSSIGSPVGDARSGGSRVVSLLNRDIISGEPLHLRVLSQIQLSRSSANILRGRGLTGLLDIAIQEHGEQAVDRALATQFLPPSEQLMADESGPALLDERLLGLTRFLEGRGVVMERA
jgi:hypothetical protein